MPESVAFIAAMQSEFKTLRRLISKTSDKQGFTPSIYCSGIGPGRARTCAQSAIAEGADALFSVGLVGALTAGLQVGDIVAPSEVLNASQDAYAVSPWPSQAINEAKGIQRMITVEAPVLGVGNRRALFESCGAECVDMEAAAIAQVAIENNKPFYCIRVVSDTLNSKLPDELVNALKPDGQVDIKHVLIAILSKPWLLSRLFSAGGEFRVAVNQLTRLVDRL